MPGQTRFEEYKHLLASQRLVFEDVKKAKEATVRAGSAKVLIALIQLKREIRMQPKPKPVDVTKTRKSKAQPISPVDPSQA